MLAALMAADWCVIAAYLAGIFLVGLYFTRRAGKSTTEFFASGRSVPWWLVVGAIVFAILVSMVSGLYPAARAARLDPVQALRYE